MAHDMEVSMGARWARGLLSALVVALAATAVVLGLPSTAGAATTGDVYVVHGLAGSTADIVVDDDTVAAAAAPKTVVGPLRLAPGKHVLTLKSGSNSLVSGEFTVTAGTSSDVVAHRSSDASRSAVITVFPNDLRAIAPGKARLVVAHTATAPPADIRDKGEVLFRNVANGESLTLEVPPGTCVLDIVPTATSGPTIMDPVSVVIQPGTLTRVYAIGDASAGTTDAVVHVLRLSTSGGTRPSIVRTGDGGQAADSFTGGRSPMTWALIAALACFAGLIALNRRSTSAPVIGSRHSR